MSASIYRPSGILGWLISHSPKFDYGFIGCIGTEERSLSSYQQLSLMGLISESKLFKIKDLESQYTPIQDKCLVARVNDFVKIGGDLKDIETHFLLERYFKITNTVEQFLKNKKSIVLDITSLPKRYFFPILKKIYNNSDIENLMLTYTIPGKYSTAKLAYNYDDWAPLPLFSGKYTKDKTDLLIINVGFSPMGLQDEATPSDPGIKTKLLFPFPAPPIAVERSWKFVRKIQKHKPLGTYDLHFIGINDISEAFDRILSLTENGQKKTLLAPYGPKTISCAMCLFATLTESEVYYTQPTFYNPTYSTGVSHIDGSIETYAYWIRLEGKNYYTLT